jgi:D-lactate dehydrogenase (cytochrome)
MLLMEFHGSPAGVKEQAEMVQDIAANSAAMPLNGPAPRRAHAPVDARHNAYFAAVQPPGCPPSPPTPACPSAAWPTACSKRAEAEASGIPYFLVGHVGDGNFHFGYLIDPDSPEERARPSSSTTSWSRALRLGGTCTGEHGVGIHKMGFLRTKPAMARWT